MSAYDLLRSALTTNGVSGDEAEDVARLILDEHARELAAAIRAEYEGHPRPGRLDPYWAADLIDPDEEA